ncbi:MAG: asparagine synthase-related protein [Pseudomonadota bacterium]
MQRYLAFSWPTEAEAAGAQAQAWSARLAEDPQWTPALRWPGLEVWTARGRRTSVRELGPQCVVIGDVLDRRSGAAARLPGLPDRPEAAARRLRDDTWGGYLALLRDPSDRGALWAYREPSGTVDAFAWRLGQVTAIADDIDRLAPGFAPADLALDWNAIAAIVADVYATGHLSPLAGYAAVAPGDLLRLDRPGQPPVPVWRPADHARNLGGASAAELRQAVVGVVGGLAQAHERILVDVSGGLDSSIVAAALAAAGSAGRVAAAVNHYPAEAEGDERAWAEAVCARHGLPFEAVPRCGAPLEEADFAELARQIGPALAGVDVPRDRAAGTLARRHGASALFGGQGGDAVFFQLPSAQVARDLLQARGVRGLADPLLPAWARWLRRSYWSVLAEALRPPRAASPPGWRALLGPRARGLSAPEHPWLRDLDGLPPAKRLQVKAIVGVSHHHWGRARRSRAAEVVQPLLAQPLVELCLATPAWRHVAGGRDRALARCAFAGDLPPEVTQRRSKGALAVHYARRVAASLDFLRPHLLDGVLADAGVLDRAAMDAALTPQALIWSADAARLTRAALVESWVRYWQGRAPDLAQGARR